MSFLSLSSPLCGFLSVSLSLQTPEELEDDSDFEQEDYDVRSRTSVQTEDDQLIAGQSARVSTNPHTSSEWALKSASESKGSDFQSSGLFKKGWDQADGAVEVFFFMSNLFK